MEALLNTLSELFQAISDLLIGFFVVPIIISTIHLRYFKIRDAHPAGPAGFQNVVESNNWAKNYLGVSRLKYMIYSNKNQFNLVSFHLCRCYHQFMH